MAPPDYFPVGARVVLKGLVKAPELNGKVGVVKSGLTSGRQQVLLEESSKSVALKVSNLGYEGRPVDSLTIKELKSILLSKSHATDAGLTGLDKVDLVRKVQALKNASPENFAQWLAEAQANINPASNTRQQSKKQQNVDPTQAADQLSNMNPEQLRQQARMMRTMNPDAIRRMNPQLAHMTNAQIQAAANQMEMLANNPTMMKMATDKMKNMSPEELQQMQNAAPGTTPMPNTGMPNMPTPQSSASAADMMANMTPEQLKQQADMFESMSPDQIRKMNPQVANMTDEQIKMAANQFRMMADNPEMMKMAMDQMKNMSPEEIEAIRSGQGSMPADPAANPFAAGGDPSKILANMDKKQLRNMFKMMKDNPDMVKQLAASSGLSEEQLSQGMAMFSDMDDAKLDMALGTMQFVEKTKNAWNDADAKAGGQLMKIVIFLGILVFGLFIWWLFFSGGSATTIATTKIVEDAIPVLNEVKDEFDNEF